MSYPTSFCTSFLFQPDSIYLLFIKLDGWCCAGVFHHSNDNKGRLAYAIGGVPGPQTPGRGVFLFERNLKQGIETEFTVIAAYEMASLHYHKWLPNPHFISSEGTLVNENRWIEGVLFLLNERWKHGKLVWTYQETVPPEFERLARKYTPSVLFLDQALRMRHGLYGVAGPNHRNQELELYAADTWS